LLGHGTATVLLSSAAAAACVAVLVNTWLQLGWLTSVWLHKHPTALVEQVVFAALASLAWLATLVAARRGRARAVLAPALRWTPVLLVLGWCWIWLLPTPRQHFELLHVFAGAACAWCVLVALGSWRESWPRRLVQLERALLVLAASVVATELGLRATRAVLRPHLLTTPGDDVVAWIEAYRRPPGSKSTAFPSDSSGFPDREPLELGPAKPWIACIGDSFSVGVVPHHRHYTTLAERELGVDVYNLGVVGAGPREYFHLLERHALPRSPRLVVIALFVGNDLEDSERESTGWLERWFDAREVLVCVAPSRAWRRVRTGGFEAGAIEDGALPNSALPQATQSVEDIERRLPHLADPLLERAPQSRERFLYIEFNRARWLAADMAERAAPTLAWLERIRDAAAPIPVACLLIPDEFQVEDAVWNEVLAEGLPAHLDRDAPQRFLGPELRRRGFEYVDLLPALRAVPPMDDGRRHLYHLRDTHFNARGNAVAARGLVEIARRFGFE
jgi:hypothetical protein